MPFINGKFYMNPAYGRAVEDARDAEAPSQSDDSIKRAQPDGDGHWVTINHHHVLIDEGRDQTARRPRKRMSSALKVSSSSRGTNDSVVTFIPTARGTRPSGMAIESDPTSTFPIPLLTHRQSLCSTKTQMMQLVRSIDTSLLICRKTSSTRS